MKQLNNILFYLSILIIKILNKKLYLLHDKVPEQDIPIRLDQHDVLLVLISLQALVERRW